MPYKNKADYTKYQRGYQRERWRKLRIQCIQMLGGACIDCKDKDPDNLEFDHVHDEKIAPIPRLYRLEGKIGSKTKIELAKCELRCLACHTIRDGRLIRDKWGEFKRSGKSTNSHKNKDEVPF